MLCLATNHADVLLFQTAEVDSWVLKVPAEDKDIFPEYNTVTYSIVNTFVLTQESSIMSVIIPMFKMNGQTLQLR